MSPTHKPVDELAWIEGLRGLAAVMVLFTHYVGLVQPQGPGTWGLAATGVDLFFVLSGFVFTRVLAAGTVPVAAHLVRRFFRLYPLYLVALLVYALLRPADGRWEALPAHLVMGHTLGSLQVAGAYNVAFWSLPPEVEYYLLLPLLAPCAAAIARRGVAALLPLLAMALILKLGLVSLAQPGESPESLRSVLTIHAPGLLVEFVLGSAVAVWGGHVPAPTLGRAWSASARRMAGLLGLGGLLALVVLYAQHLASPQAAAQAPLWLAGTVGLWAAAAYAGLMLWMPVGRNEGAWVGPAQWAGRLSYGVYLFHNAAPTLIQKLWPSAQGWALLGAATALTLVMALLLHLAIEAPARAAGRRWTLPSSRQA